MRDQRGPKDVTRDVRRDAPRQVDTLYGISGLLIIAVVAGAAFFTKPSPESFDQHLNTELRSEVSQALQSKQKEGGIVGLAMRVGCSVDINTCVRLLRSQMQIDEKDLVVARYMRVLTRDEEKNCLGAFKTWLCTGFNPR